MLPMTETVIICHLKNLQKYSTKIRITSTRDVVADMVDDAIGDVVFNAVVNTVVNIVCNSGWNVIYSSVCYAVCNALYIAVFSSVCNAVLSNTVCNVVYNEVCNVVYRQCSEVFTLVCCAVQFAINFSYCSKEQSCDVCKRTISAEPFFHTHLANLRNGHKMTKYSGFGLKIAKSSCSLPFPTWRRASGESKTGAHILGSHVSRVGDR